MLVELGLVRSLGNTVEVGEEVRRERPGLVGVLFRHAQQIVDQHLRVDLLLDVERRCMNDEIAPVLLVLAAPDELRVEVGVAPVADFRRPLLLRLENRLELRRGNIYALGLVVRERFDDLRGGFSVSHVVLHGLKPMVRFGWVFRAVSSAMSCLIASKIAANCSSYFFSIASILRARSRFESISRRSWTKVRMMAIFTSTARGERRTLES